MKQLSILELNNLLGGAISSCEEVQFMASTHDRPDSDSEEVEKAENKFWENWLELYDQFCK